MNVNRKNDLPPAESNESNVREHGLKNLNKIERSLSSVFGASIPVDIYKRIRANIERGPYDKVYTRIDIFTKFYISLTSIKKKLNVSPETLIKDEKKKIEASIKVWTLIENAYWDGEIRSYMKDITEALSGFIIPEEK